jgi:hypothetical protein
MTGSSFPSVDTGVFSSCFLLSSSVFFFWSCREAAGGEVCPENFAAGGFSLCVI